MNLRALNQWWLPSTERYEEVDEIFGNTEWRQCLAISEPSKKEECLNELYRRSLGGTNLYIRDFRMKNQHNQTAYYLIYATHSTTGLAVMKQAMRAVDPSGFFSYSDVTNPNQPFLLGKEFDSAHGEDLAAELLKRQAGAETRKEDLERFVDEHERYVRPHLTKALGILVSQRGVTASTAKRGRGWPAGTVFRFPATTSS